MRWVRRAPTTEPSRVTALPGSPLTFLTTLTLVITVIPGARFRLREALDGVSEPGDLACLGPRGQRLSQVPGPSRQGAKSQCQGQRGPAWGEGPALSLAGGAGPHQGTNRDVGPAPGVADRALVHRLEQPRMQGHDPQVHMGKLRLGEVTRLGKLMNQLARCSIQGWYVLLL